MTTRQFAYATLAVLLFSVAGQAHAQSWSKAQSEVWDVVIGSYKDIDARDANWSDKWVWPDAMVWGGSYPMPRNRDSVKRWDTFQFGIGKSHVAEYSPAAIVVQGSTAVAHYYYSNAGEDKDGKLETTHGRCSDILSKDKGQWKFIAWHCTDEPGDD